MAKLQTESAEFKTQKSLQELTQILRRAANQLDAQVQAIRDDDPLGGFDLQPNLAVALSGKIGFLGGLKHFRNGSAHDTWGVQVYVYDKGVERQVELIAVGETGMFRELGALNLAASKERLETILSMLR